VALSCDVLRSCCRESCHSDSALASCEQDRLSNLSDLAQAIEDDVVEVNPTAFDRCLSRMRLDLSCEKFLGDVTAFFPGDITECSGVFDGPGEGDDCQNTDECISLGANYDCLDGKCRDIPYQGLAEPCFRTTSITNTGPGGAYWSSPDSYEIGDGQCLLQEGLYCKDGVCAPTLTEGADCSDDFEGCAPDLFCSDGVCRPYRSTQAACEETDRCLEGLCLDGACTAVKFPREFCEEP
jgi:hypothetical protein